MTTPQRPDIQPAGMTEEDDYEWPMEASPLRPEQIKALRKAGREFAAANARLTAAFQAFGEGIRAGSIEAEAAPDLRAALERAVRHIESVEQSYLGGPTVAGAEIVEQARAALAAPAADGLDVAWREAQAALPKSKGRWGYSIASLSYGVGSWCATAHGNLSGEHLEGYGATPEDALRSLKREALREPSREPGEEG